MTNDRFSKLINAFILLLLILATSLPTFSQPLDDSQPRDGVEMLARPLQDSIMLRWAPTSSVAWYYGNKYGYEIERVTILRDGKVLSQPVTKKLRAEPLKPLPMEDWRVVVDTSDYGAVVAQALYGEDFEVDGGQSTSMMSIYNRAREQESRYSFSLFAADQAFWLAKISGLGFTDRDVKENEKYLYRVYIKSDPMVFAADTAFAYVSVKDYKELPAPLDLNAKFGDQFAMLSWNSEVHNGIYSSFIIERSDDGKNFKAISDTPHVNTYEGEKPKTPFTFRSDSLPQNDKKYFYRVRGRNAFGELGPPSDTVSGMGHKALASTPAIFKAESPDNKEMHIQWQFKQELNDEIEGFTLLRSRYDSGPYDEIALGIPADERSFVDPSPGTDNYYKILATGKHGGMAISSSYFAQLVDSIPPAKPEGIAGRIDTTGIVSLNWDRNTDEDLQGYRVYKSNFKNDEFIQITSSPITMEQFTDTITLNSLTETIYYKVAAVDHRFNISELSEPIELQKPDQIPPTSPILKNMESSAEGIKVSWIPSSSEDVSRHVLYRSQKAEIWTVIKDFGNTDSTNFFLDKSTVPGRKYLYTIVAVDDAGLESEPAKPLAGEKTDWKVRPAIENLDIDVDRTTREITLAWYYDQPAIDRFVIYRATGEEPIRIYTSVPANENRFVDKKLKIDTKYTYLIKAIFADGAESEFSRKVEARY